MRLILYQILGLTIFLVVGAFALLFVEGYRFKTDDGTVVKTGIVRLQFSLPDAILFIDGKEHKGTFPFTIELTPGLKTFRIEKTGFHPWEKKILVSQEKISLWNQIFLAPLSIREDDISILWPTLPEAAKNEDFLSLSKNTFGYFDRTLSLFIVFNLGKDRDGMIEKIWNVPFTPDALQAFDEKSILAFIEKGKKKVFDFEKHDFVLEADPIFLKAHMSQRVLSSIPLLPTFPLPAKPLAGVQPKNSHQLVLLLENGVVFLVDESGENGHSLYLASLPAKITPMMFYNKDFSRFALPTKEGLLFFDLQQLNERTSEETTEAFSLKFPGRAVLWF